MSALQSDSIAAIMPALLKAEEEFTPAKKDATNPHFRSSYASLDSVIDAVRPALLKNGIAVMQPTRHEAGRTVLVTRLVHKSGEWLGSEYPVNPVQQSPQAEGSALTYARRYALLALCGIAPEDDDGEAASAGPQRGAQPRRQAPEPRAYEDPEPLSRAIDAATTKEELGDVGVRVGAAWLPDDVMDRLRQSYRDRMAELTGTAAA